MNIDLSLNDNYFELLPIGASQGRQAQLIRKKRVLIGRSQACDIVLPHNEVTAIHAVLEIHGDKFKIFDMNSTNGTYVNGKRVIVEACHLNDVIKLGPLEFRIQKYKAEDVAPPPLDMLRPEALPPRIQQAFKPVLPTKVAIPEEDKFNLPEKPAITEEGLPTVVYPLAKDPKAEFSEYIFEDADTIYPIFKYEVQRAAVEIIILFQDRIFSVDYIPLKDGTYRLVGKKPADKEVEFAYLGGGDKVDFVEIKGNEVFIHPLHGYEVLSLADKKKENSSGPLYLGQDDILRFKNGELQIFVRPTESPPKIKPAPILRRDGDLKKYLLLMFLLCVLILTGLSLFEVDEELEQEKVPERIATILYQTRPVVSPKPPIEKTETAPKEVVQKSPQQQKPQPKPAEKKPDRETPKETTAQKAGSKTAKETAPAKKAQANQAQVERKQDTVRPQRQQRAQQKSSSTAASPQKAPNQTAAKGNVDTYKSADFSSTISSVLTRGGSTRSAQAASTASSASSSSSVSSGGESATVRRADVSNNVGSLSGAAQGRLDESRGVEGLVSQRNIYTAGLPFKEVVLGGMDPDTIRRILIDHIPQFRHCYQKELDRSANQFDGVVRLDFIIGASGNVTRAGIQAASDGLPVSVKNCVVDVLRGIKFPAPLGGGVVEVNQPFNFYPRR